MTQKKTGIRVLHTADWHLGRMLYGRKRSEEFEKFLAWLLTLLDQENIDVLLIAGDIFDTGTPSNQMQELYYDFLGKVRTTGCRHVVVVSGNHDSPTFLDAPRQVFRHLDVHVIGTADASGKEEVIGLRNAAGDLELIVGAVPYLRDRDARISEAGESIADKDQKMVEGIRQHYAQVAEFAQEMRQEANANIPILGMGHLFVAGGKTVDGDGVRELYVGTLGHVGVDIFPEIFDYVALGHLHVPQIVHGIERIRYSGSPIPMGFGEVGQKKSVVLLDIASSTNAAEIKPPVAQSADSTDQGIIQNPSTGTQINWRLLPIPLFQRLEIVRGPLEDILAKLEALQAEDEMIWLEVTHDGKEQVPDLRKQLEDCAEGSKLEFLRVRDLVNTAGILTTAQEMESLDSLTREEVFQRCLDANHVTEEEQKELLQAYQEILQKIDEADPLAI